MSEYDHLKPEERVTCHEEIPPLGARVRPEKGTDDEAIKIFRRADHRDFAGA